MPFMKMSSETSGSPFCSSHIMTSYCVFITEQTTAKSYLFVLYNKKKKTRIRQVADSLLLSTQTIGNLKKSKFYKYHAYTT